MPSITYIPVIHKGEKRILIKFAYDQTLANKLRQNTDARWSKTHRAWHIADNPENRIKCKLTIEKDTLIEKTIVPIEIEKKTTLKKPIVSLSVLIKKPKQEERIVLSYKTNKEITTAIRQINGIKWCGINKHWHLPCTKAHYEGLQNAIANFAIIEDEALSQYLIKKKNGLIINKNFLQKDKANIFFNISTHNLQLLTKTVEQLQLKVYSTSTIKTYKNEISIFLQTLKNKKADGLQTEDVRRYIHYCIEKLALTENTIHSRLNALKFMYEQVLGHEKFFVTIPRPKKHLQLPKVLGEEELRRLFAAPTNLKHKAILFIAYSAGLRVSEVINLRLQDIDRERQQLFIYCSKGKKDRYVRLSPMVLDVLEQYYKMSTVKPVNYLFEGLVKGEPYTIRSAQQIFTDAKIKAGIIKTVSFHNLRHSFATHLLEKGVDVIFIKEILGHFDIKTTERYLHVRRNVLINIDSPLDDLYKGKIII